MRVLTLLWLVAFSWTWSCQSFQRSPKTQASMLQWRLDHAMCRRHCPEGRDITRLDEDPNYDPLADCCIDSFGVGWSSCAWNGAGRFMSHEDIMRDSRLGGDCGGEGYPDCAVGK